MVSAEKGDPHGAVVTWGGIGSNAWTLYSQVQRVAGDAEQPGSPGSPRLMGPALYLVCGSCDFTSCPVSFWDIPFYFCNGELQLKVTKEFSGFSTFFVLACRAGHHLSCSEGSGPGGEACVRLAENIAEGPDLGAPVRQVWVPWFEFLSDQAL